MNKKDSPTGVRDLYRLYVVLKHTFEALYKSGVADLRKYGMTPEQAGALILLKNIGEKATPAEMSAWLFRAPHSTLNLLRRMQKLGLIDMNPDSGNKHIIRISVTKKGDEIYHHVTQYNSSINTFYCLSRRDRQKLWSLLKVLREKALENLKLDSKTMSRLTAALMLPFSNVKDDSPVSHKNKTPLYSSR